MAAEYAARLTSELDKATGRKPTNKEVNCSQTFILTLQATMKIPASFTHLPQH